MTPWGPTTVTGTASDGTAYGQALSAIGHVHPEPSALHDQLAGQRELVRFTRPGERDLRLSAHDAIDPGDVGHRVQTATTMHIQH